MSLHQRFVFCLLAGVTLTTAQEVGELETDRPDFTESTGVITKNWMQFESGLTFGSDREAGTKTYSIIGGTPLLRLGVGHRTELRFGTEAFRWSSIRHSDEPNATHGFADFSVGAKFSLFEEKGLRPGFSVIPILSLPTGHQSFTSSGYDPMIKLAWSRSLPHEMSLGGNVNFASLSSGDRRFFQRAYSFTVGHPVAAGFNTYWEAYAIQPGELDAGTSWIANAGLTHPVGRNMQIDVEFGRELTRQPCWFVGVGFAIRQPLAHILSPLVAGMRHR